MANLTNLKRKQRQLKSIGIQVKATLAILMLFVGLLVLLITVAFKNNEMLSSGVIIVILYQVVMIYVFRILYKDLTNTKITLDKEIAFAKPMQVIVGFYEAENICDTIRRRIKFTYITKDN